MKSIGMDIGKRKCFYCVKAKDGKILKEGNYVNTLYVANMFAKTMIVEYGQCQAVCESTGNM